ncbi:hypothetical protein D3C79_402700 [compost metagenome]
MRFDPLVVRVGAERATAVADKVQRPLPLTVAQLVEGPGTANLRQQLCGSKAAAQGHADQVLDQHIQAQARRTPGFDVPRSQSLARRRCFHQLQAVRRHQGDPRRPAGRMPRAPGALHQARDTFGRTDLQHPLDRQEIHPKVEAGRADDGLEGALLEVPLDPIAGFPGQRGMVQSDQPSPLRARLEQGLVPQFRLGAGVGEHQAAGAGVDLAADRIEHLQPHVTRPGKAFDLPRQERIDLQLFVLPTLYQQAAVWQQHLKGMRQVAECGRQPPGHQRWLPTAQARQRQLQLHTALVAQQFMPFVDHHQPQAGEILAGLRAGQQQGQAFGGGDQGTGQAPGLPGTLGATGVAAAYADTPVECQVVQRLLQGACGVGGQGAHGGDPQHLQRGGLAPCCLARECAKGAQPDGVGLAGAGAGMQQTGLAPPDSRPDASLEGKGRPVAGGEPGSGEVGGGGHAGTFEGCASTDRPPARLVLPDQLPSR